MSFSQLQKQALENLKRSQSATPTPPTVTEDSIVTLIPPRSKLAKSHTVATAIGGFMALKLQGIIADADADQTNQIRPATA